MARLIIGIEYVSVPVVAILAYSATRIDALGHEAGLGAGIIAALGLVFYSVLLFVASTVAITLWIRGALAKESNNLLADVIVLGLGALGLAPALVLAFYRV